MKQVLLLGCGTSREKKIRLSADEAADFSDCELTTIDMDPNCNPTKVYEISQGLPPEWGPEMFDEIHAYDSLEHWGVQGDWRGWFAEMERYHSLLRPGGKFFCLVPVGEDRFADPGHTRFMSTNWFNVLWVLAEIGHSHMRNRPVHVPWLYGIVPHNRGLPWICQTRIPGLRGCVS